MLTENAKPINLNSKKKLRDKIREETEQFLNNGGQIYLCKIDETAYPNPNREFMKKDIFKIKENMDREAQGSGNDNTSHA